MNTPTWKKAKCEAKHVPWNTTKYRYWKPTPPKAGTQYTIEK